MNITNKLNNLAIRKKMDVEYGLKKEDEKQPFLEKIFNCKLTNTKETKGKYCPFDFENDERKIRIEYKDRKYKWNTFKNLYNDMIFYERKIRYGDEYDGDHYYIFGFEDNVFIGLKHSDYKNELNELPRNLEHFRRGDSALCVRIPLSWMKQF